MDDMDDKVGRELMKDQQVISVFKMNIFHFPG